MNKLIVAMDKNRAIGAQGGIPWKIPADMKNFAKLTTGHVVIMGRKTWESIPKRYRPLPDRINIIVSKTLLESEQAEKLIESSENIVITRDIDTALMIAEDKYAGKDVWFIGGEGIYREALERYLVDELYLTSVMSEGADYNADTYFPDTNASQWDEDKKYFHAQPAGGDGNEYATAYYKYKLKPEYAKGREGLTFGDALEALKKGKRIARKGWNGKDMFLFYLPPGQIPKSAIHDAGLRKVIDEQVEGNHFEALGSIRMWTADKKILTGWLASQTDMLAEDWEIL